MGTVKVLLSSDVYFVCLTHALSTEREEVMGLLIGEVDKYDVLRISSAVLLRRSDKKKDRVEISPEQLSSAVEYAQTLSENLNRPMRVLGWYHSHPHITVWPSHIDLRTQASYQMMDKSFVGLIFSVFNQDSGNTNTKTSSNDIRLTCFQSTNSNPEGEQALYERLDIPIFIVPSKKLNDHCLDSLLKLPEILSIEEKEIFLSTRNYSSQDSLAKLTNEAAYTRAHCRIVETVSSPLQQTLIGIHDRRDTAILLKKERLNQLEETLKNLEPHCN